MKDAASQNHTSVDAEAQNDRLAREHSINDYYARSPWVIRWIEGQRLQIIREFAALVDGQRLLEVGSGGGHVLRLFPAGRLTAVDVSDVFLETARQNLIGYDVEFKHGELDELDLPPASYDCVVCTEVLEHVPYPARILKAIPRLLKPSGRAVITVPVDPLINGLKQLVRRTPVGWAIGNRLQWGGDRYHLHQWWPRQFRRELLERFFRVERERAAPFAWLPLRACFLCRPR